MPLLSTILSRFRRPDDDPLERLLIKAGQSTGRRNAFYRTLLQSKLYVPGEIRDGEMFIQPYDLDDRKTLLVFTSPQRMAEGLRERPAFFVVDAPALLASLPPFDALVLNYRTRSQKECTPSEIRALLDGSIFHETTGTANASGSIILGQPKQYPVRLMEELKAKLPSRPDVRAAYLAQIFDPATMQTPRIVIAFETDMGADTFETFRTNAARLADACEAGDVIFSRLENDGLGEYMRQEAGPFYSFEF